MNRHSILILFAMAFLALAGCHKEQVLTDGGNITVQASVGTMTKVSGDKAAFTAGDGIVVYGWLGGAAEVPSTRVVDGVVNTLGADGLWTPAIPMRWKPGADAHYFLGVYPVHTISDFTADSYTLDPDDAASDLLIATNLGGVKAADGPVALAFDHAMAKLVVNLKFRNEFGGTPTVTGVTASAKGTATVNYLTKAVTATGDAAAVNIPAAASAPSGYALSFSGLQVPQEGVRNITVTIGAKRYVYEAAADIPLHGGQYTTLDLTVGKDKIELSAFSIEAWGTEVNLPDADALRPDSGGQPDSDNEDPYNSHEYVDLGLPSGLKWATCNVGATKPEEFGDYFAWGETQPKEDYSWTTYKWCKGSSSTLTKYNTDSAYGDVDNKTALDPQDDAARVNWGGFWHIPSLEELEELHKYCTWDKYNSGNTVFKGVGGYKVTSNVPGYTDRFIFLPAAGHREGTGLNGTTSCVYWLNSAYYTSPYALHINNEGGYYRERYRGMPVRPVCSPSGNTN